MRIKIELSRETVSEILTEYVRKKWETVADVHAEPAHSYGGDWSVTLKDQAEIEADKKREAEMDVWRAEQATKKQAQPAEAEANVL